MLELTANQTKVLEHIYRTVQNNGRRVRTRKQGEVTRTLRDLVIFASNPKNSRYVPQNVSDEVCMSAASSVANHKGPWEDSLRRPLQLIASWKAETNRIRRGE